MQNMRAKTGDREREKKAVNNLEFHFGRQKMWKFVTL